MAPYISFATTFSSIVDSSRFFSPVLSSLLVTYIYFVIGAHTKNSLWKLLYYVCNSGLISNLFYTLRYIAISLNMKPYNIILEWPEAIFFGFYEWGLVYLNFVKIRTCIKTLQIKFWKIFINLLFLFTMGFRLFTTYCSNANIKISFLDEDKTNAIIYTPIAILEIYFIILIIYTILNEDDDDKSRESLGILLNSSLTRMLFVSLILLSIAILTYIGFGDGFKLLAKRLLVKLKGAIGIIYLIDLLLIRIDLDNNTIKKQELQILKFCVKEKNHQDHHHNNYNGDDDEENESETFGFDPEDPYGLNKSPMDYMQHSKHSSVISKLPSNISTLQNTYNNNGNIPRNSPISDYNNANIYRNSPISEYNNTNIYLSSPTSDYIMQIYIEIVLILTLMIM